jgi:hypothetical protein
MLSEVCAELCPIDFVLCVASSHLPSDSTSCRNDCVLSGLAVWGWSPDALLVPRGDERRRDVNDRAAAACRNESSEMRIAVGRALAIEWPTRNERCGKLDASRPTPISMAGQLEKRIEDPDRRQQTSGLRILHNLPWKKFAPPPLLAS